ANPTSPSGTPPRRPRPDRRGQGAAAPQPDGRRLVKEIAALKGDAPERSHVGVMSAGAVTDHLTLIRNASGAGHPEPDICPAIRVWHQIVVNTTPVDPARSRGGGGRWWPGEGLLVCGAVD